MTPVSVELKHAWESFSLSQMKVLNGNPIIRYVKAFDQVKKITPIPEKEWMSLHSTMMRTVSRQPPSQNKQALLFLLKENKDTKNPKVIKDLYRYTESLVMTGRLTLQRRL